MKTITTNRSWINKKNYGYQRARGQLIVCCLRAFLCVSSMVPVGNEWIPKVATG